MNKTKTTTRTEIHSTTTCNKQNESPSPVILTNGRKIKRTRYDSPISETSSYGSADTDYSNDIGNVGYKFRKFFPGYGYFDGIVKEIRKGAKGMSNVKCQIICFLK